MSEPAQPLVVDLDQEQNLIEPPAQAPEGTTWTVTLFEDYPLPLS